MDISTSHSVDNETRTPHSSHAAVARLHLHKKSSFRSKTGYAELLRDIVVIDIMTSPLKSGAVFVNIGEQNRFADTACNSASSNLPFNITLQYRWQLDLAQNPCFSSLQSKSWYLCLPPYEHASPTTNRWQFQLWHAHP